MLRGQADPGEPAPKERNRDGFSVRPLPSRGGEQLAAEFNVTDVRAINGRFQSLIVSMDPPNVRVKLSRNVERPVTMHKRIIDVHGDETVLERLYWDDAHFDPISVKIRGPKKVLDDFLKPNQAVFVFEATPSSEDAPSIEAVLQLAIADERVTMDPEQVTIRIPLRVEPTEKVLPEVRILLKEPPGHEGSYRAATATVEVRIEVFGSLEVELDRYDDEQLRAWGLANAVVVVNVSKEEIDSGAAGVMAQPNFMIFERDEYRVTHIPKVRIEPKDP